MATKIITFKNIPAPTFFCNNDGFIVKPGDVAIVEWIRSQIAQTEEPASDELLSWIRWYLKKEVVDVESPHTSRAKVHDLWKFAYFFYKRNKGHAIELWDKPCTQSFIDALETQYDIATVERIYATISNFWTFLVRHEVAKAKDDPIRGIRKRRREQLPPARGIDVLSNISTPVPDYNSNEKFGMLIAAVDSFKQVKYRDAARDKAILAVLYKTGLRASELCSLTIKQMDREVSTGGCWLHNVHGKGKSTRRVYIPSEALVYLDAYLAAKSDIHKREKDFIFHTRNMKQLCQKDLWRILNRVAQQASILYLPEGYFFRISPHALRHERGYNLRKSGHGERFIAFALGHADTTQIPRYSIGSDKDEAEMLEYS